MWLSTKINMQPATGAPAQPVNIVFKSARVGDFDDLGLDVVPDTVTLVHPCPFDRAIMADNDVHQPTMIFTHGKPKKLPYCNYYTRAMLPRDYMIGAHALMNCTEKFGLDEQSIPMEITLGVPFNPGDPKQYTIPEAFTPGFDYDKMMGQALLASGWKRF